MTPKAAEVLKALEGAAIRIGRRVLLDGTIPDAEKPARVIVDLNAHLALASSPVGRMMVICEQDLGPGPWGDNAPQVWSDAMTVVMASEVH